MGKLKRHGIAFDQEEPFDAGSTLKGYVFIELTAPLQVRGIRLKFRGKGKVQWSEQQGSGDKRRTVVHRATEDYLNHSILLYGIWPDDGNETTEIPPGTHNFPFEFELPRSLPASFKHTLGFVKYHFKSAVDLPWKIDPTFKQCIQIRPIADLNLDPANKVGLSDENEKNLCCLCCKSGLISAMIRLEKRGFVPGEEIKIFAKVNNGSGKKIDATYVTLTKGMVFRAGGRVEVRTEEIARVSRPPIAAHGSDDWAGQSLVVPPTPPSGFPGCKIIGVEYVLQFGVFPSLCSFDLKIPLLIKIGTIPVRQDQVEQPPDNTEESQVQAGDHTSVDTSSLARDLTSIDEHTSVPSAGDQLDGAAEAVTNNVINVREAFCSFFN